MSDENDYDPGLANIADERSGVMRFLPMMVVGVAITGFFVLAWYAYHAGTKSMKEEDLLLVEADSNPFKEAPEDPGGMKFPHQDKTIFEAISGESGKAPQVERVLPAPEEPMEKPQAENDTKSWVNESLRTEKKSVEELMPTPPGSSHALEADRSAAPVADDTPKDEVQAVVKDAPVEIPKDVVEAKPSAAPKEVPKPVVKEEQKSVVKEEPKAVAATTTTARGNGNIQLAAFRSEEEAMSQWKKIQSKNASLLGGFSPKVQRADLGDKGVFYRLQVPGVADPKGLCAKLTVAGQACIVVK